MADPIQRATEADDIRVTEDGVSTRVTEDTTNRWPWCPMPGASTTSTLAVDVVAFGDGYTHRATRGLNPVRPAWSLAFPFVTRAQLQAYDDFLRANALAGFYITPPDQAAEVFVVCDDWSSQINERTRAGDMCGTLQATFVRSFNPH